jgi:transcriptional regulator GlxA family with amidase domain
MDIKAFIGRNSELSVRMSEIRVGILIFDGVEVLDFCGPFEVFSVTRRSTSLDGSTSDQPVPAHHEQAPAFRVVLVAETTQRPVTTTGGMKVLADVDYGSCPSLDVLLVPGGIGTRKEISNVSTLDFVTRHQPHLDVLASVCTGSLILSQAGILNGQRATTHWVALDLMEEQFPSVHVVRDKRWTGHENAVGRVPSRAPSEEQLRVDAATKQHVFTSAGISAGIDMSLKIVEHLLGEKVAQRTAQYMEYPYPESDDRRVQL